MPEQFGSRKYELYTSWIALFAVANLSIDIPPVITLIISIMSLWTLKSSSRDTLERVSATTLVGPGKYCATMLHYNRYNFSCNCTNFPLTEVEFEKFAYIVDTTTVLSDSKRTTVPLISCAKVSIAIKTASNSLSNAHVCDYVSENNPRES